MNPKLQQPGQDKQHLLAALPCYESVMGCLDGGRVLIQMCELQEEQSEMDDMYSRGIDPNIADPSKCHSHPDVPPQWPPKPKVQAYVQRVGVLLLPCTAALKLHNTQTSSTPPSPSPSPPPTKNKAGTLQRDLDNIPTAQPQITVCCIFNIQCLSAYLALRCVRHYPCMCMLPQVCHRAW